jgi:ribosomal protein L7/L12
MLVTRTNVIAATEKIIELHDSEKRKLLMSILASSPTIMLRALDIGPARQLFKVVLIKYGMNKINVIKSFREVCGVGLADAKDWAEGKTVHDKPSGVFGEKLPREDAEKLLKWVNTSLNGSATAEIVPQETTVRPLPYAWNQSY